MRGSEGEPTATMQRLPEMHFLPSNDQEITSPEERFSELSPFTTIDSQSTALVTSKIIKGKLACPGSI